MTCVQINRNMQCWWQNMFTNKNISFIYNSRDKNKNVFLVFLLQSRALIVPFQGQYLPPNEIFFLLSLPSDPIIFFNFVFLQVPDYDIMKHVFRWIIDATYSCMSYFFINAVYHSENKTNKMQHMLRFFPVFTIDFSWMPWKYFIWW